MLVWVTGAAGFVGSTLVERLRARGDRVVAIVRPGSQHRAPRDVHVVETELPNVSPLLGLSKPDAIFHCAAALDRDDADAYALHVDATLELARMSADARFVHVSTTEVLKPSADRALSEDSACAPRTAYARTKLEGERLLLAARPDAAVLRPPGVYGPRSRRDVVVTTARRIQRGTYFHIGNGDAARSWVFVETLVDALMHAADHALRGVFLVDDGRPVSERELAREISYLLGRGPHFPSVPVSLANWLAPALDKMSAPFGLRSPLSTEAIRLRSTPFSLDTSRLKATGFVQRYTLREALEATIDWACRAGVLRKLARNDATSQR